jgi:hypothetical protein
MQEVVPVLTPANLKMIELSIGLAAVVFILNIVLKWTLAFKKTNGEKKGPACMWSKEAILAIERGKDTLEIVTDTKELSSRQTACLESLSKSLESLTRSAQNQEAYLRVLADTAKKNGRND